MALGREGLLEHERGVQAEGFGEGSLSGVAAHEPGFEELAGELAFPAGPSLSGARRWIELSSVRCYLRT
jgi:hypothetical protein